MANKQALMPPSWVDWCTQCSAYQPHGFVFVDDAARGGYCGSCGTRHSNAAAT